MIAIHVSDIRRLWKRWLAVAAAAAVALWLVGRVVLALWQFEVPRNQTLPFLADTGGFDVGEQGILVAHGPAIRAIPARMQTTPIAQGPYAQGCGGRIRTK